MVPEAAEARRRAEVPPRLLPQRGQRRVRSTRAADAAVAEQPVRQALRGGGRRAALPRAARARGAAERTRGRRRCGRTPRRSFRCSRRCCRASVPYAMVGHSMGTWMLFETLRLLMERGIPLPAQIVVSAFPAADIAPADRPWRKSRGMGEDAFKDECRTWDINEVIFQPSMWAVYKGLLQDDFNPSTSTSTRRSPRRSRCRPRVLRRQGQERQAAPRRRVEAAARRRRLLGRRGRRQPHFFYDAGARRVDGGGGARAAVWRVGA